MEIVSDLRVPSGKFLVVNHSTERNSAAAGSEDEDLSQLGELQDLPVRASRRADFLKIFSAQFDLETWASENNVQTVLILVNRYDELIHPMLHLFTFPPPEQVKDAIHRASQYDANLRPRR